MNKIAIALVVVAFGPGAFAGCGNDSRIERAQAVLADDDRFTTGAQAAVAFGRVTSLLRADAEACADNHGDDDVRCLARFEAYAFAQVTAVAVSQCTGPNRDDTRIATRRYLGAVARSAPTKPRPQPPKAPAC